MSNKNNLGLLADLLQQYYVLPYDHDELVDLLMKIQDGYVLTKEEYDIVRLIVNPDEDDTVVGDVIFSGDYIDLINKPFIPTKLTDLKDFPTIMARINQTLTSLSDRDKELADSISDNARFLSALELVLKQDIETLTELVETAKLFQGESLESVIENIQGELGWLDELKDDIQAGKVLSERDFTATFEEILKSIDSTTEGLVGVIKNVIAESIVEPGQPNGNGVFRLDSIGEALATKVDKKYGYDLSQHNFDDTYKKILDNVVEFIADPDLVERHGIYDPVTGMDNLSGTLQGYIISIVDRYEEGFKEFMNTLGDTMFEYTKNEIQDIRAELAKRLGDMETTIENNRLETLHGVSFKEYDGPTTIDVGALPRGSDIASRTVREVLLDMLCPFAIPMVSARLELSSHCSELTMIGNVIEVKGIIAEISRGSLPIERVIFKHKVGGEYVILSAHDSLVYSHMFPEILETTKSIDSEDYIVEVYDTEGNYAYSYVQDITVVYPIYFGVIEADIESKTNEELATMVQRVQPIARYYGTECDYRYTTKDQRMFIAVPQPYGAITDVYDQNGYIITNSFKQKTISLPFYVKEVSSTGEEIRTNLYRQPYFLYYNNPSTATNFDITYKF